MLANYAHNFKNAVHKTTRICLAYVTVDKEKSPMPIFDYVNACVYLGVEPEDHGPKKRLLELGEFIDEVKKYTNDQVLETMYHKIVEKLSQIEGIITTEFTLDDLEQKSIPIGRIKKEISSESMKSDFGPGLTVLEALAHLYE